MTVPSRNFGDLLLADRTETSLFFPEVAQPSPSFERTNHLHIKSLLKVRFPGWVVGIGFCANLRMSFNPHRGSREEPYHFGLPFFVLENAGEHPTIGTS